MLNDIQEVIVIAVACKNDSESFHILAVGPSIFFFSLEVPQNPDQEDSSWSSAKQRGRGQRAEV